MSQQKLTHSMKSEWKRSYDCYFRKYLGQIPTSLIGQIPNFGVDKIPSSA